VNYNQAQLLDDIRTIDSLAIDTAPGTTDLIHAGRLFNRYKQSNDEIRRIMITRLEQIILGWSMTEEELMLECRRIWASGYHPLAHSTENIGSGSDYQDE